MSKIKVAFEGPPPRGTTNWRQAGEHEAVAEKLRAQPGEWAKVDKRENPRSSGNAAHAIRRGLIKAYQPSGTFEAKARKVDGEYRVYARYVGAPAAPAAE